LSVILTAAVFDDINQRIQGLRLTSQGRQQIDNKLARMAFIGNLIEEAGAHPRRFTQQRAPF
jgi:hypothetical protein